MTTDFNKTAQDAVGSAVKRLLDAPLITDSVSLLMQAREQAVAAQEVAMSALNIPSAADVERLTRRVRSVSQRLEGIEDALDGLSADRQVATRLTAIEKQLGDIAAALQLTRV